MKKEPTPEENEKILKIIQSKPKTKDGDMGRLISLCLGVFVLIAFNTIPQALSLSDTWKAVFAAISIMCVLLLMKFGF